MVVEFVQTLTGIDATTAEPEADTIPVFSTESVSKRVFSLKEALYSKPAKVAILLNSKLFEPLR